jgi:hypothetical protein
MIRSKQMLLEIMIYDVLCARQEMKLFVHRGMNANVHDRVGVETAIRLGTTVSSSLIEDCAMMDDG